MKPCQPSLFWILVGLLTAAPLAAAPGKLTPVGPFGNMAAGVQDLIFPGSDPQHLLIRTSSDLFESRDAGFSWRSVISNFPLIRPSGVATDPADVDTWYVVDQKGPGSQVWQTSDAGLKWSPLPIPSWPATGERALRFFVDRFDRTVLALEIHAVEESLFRRYYSRDRGTTWTELQTAGTEPQMLGINGGSLYLRDQRYEVATGASTPLSFEAVTELFFDRTRPNTLYVSVDLGPFGNFYSSIDRGANLVLLREFGHTLRVFAQSPWNPSHLALSDAVGLSLSLDRGQTWVNQPFKVQKVAYDPASGELLLADRELMRRRLDGNLSGPLPLHGLLAATRFIALATQGEVALAVENSGRSFFRDKLGIWRERGRVFPNAEACGGAKWAAILPAAPDHAAFSCEYGLSTPFGAVYLTTDAGSTWTLSPAPPPAGRSAYRLTSIQSSYFLAAEEYVYRSQDFGLTWQIFLTRWLDSLSNFAILSDSPRSAIAVNPLGEVIQYGSDESQTFLAQLAGGRIESPGSRPRSVRFYFFPVANDPMHSYLLYAIYGSVLSRSHNFGATWEVMRDMATVMPSPLRWDLNQKQTEIVIDPLDPDHILLPGRGFESRDGGLTFFTSEEARGPAVYDRIVPDRFYSTNNDRGVLEKSDTLAACPDDEKAWCARGGRYQLVVDWKDPQGRSGQARRVLTGSEDSGLFYFFDPNNWELLVKVLDGCSVNQRQWLFAAGTTDVEYVLRVEDRWTGQIRHYANKAGQAASAITDTDAFAGCSVAPPPGAVVAPPAGAGVPGQPVLELLDGRFEVKTRWTNFSGQSGNGLATPLRSENSGLFYFFDPNNWEMLIKVLDGCAINGHYWVLAAATTNVGYELKVRDKNPLSPITKTYTNPVGRAAPATIDLEAFRCAR